MPRDPGKTAKRQTLRQQRVLNPRPRDVRHEFVSEQRHRKPDRRRVAVVRGDARRLAENFSRQSGIEAAGIWINHVDDRILGVVSREESADRQLETVTVLA
jgi:hypothetical protein